MINIKVICVGKMKESCLRDACAEYLKRLRAFCSAEVTEIPVSKIPDQPSPAQIAAALDKEAELIIKSFPSSSAVFAMCIEGKLMSSPELSAKLEKLAVNGYNAAVFIIGSSYGLSQKVKDRADEKISMSPMTFPHELARVMLCEQLYRSAQISAGGKYHK